MITDIKTVIWIGDTINTCDTNEKLKCACVMIESVHPRYRMSLYAIAIAVFIRL